jgi:hypothetical protein
MVHLINGHWWLWLTVRQSFLPRLNIVVHQMTEVMSVSCIMYISEWTFWLPFFLSFFLYSFIHSSAVLWFGLMASCLVSRHSITWSMSQPSFAFSYFFARFLHFYFAWGQPQTIILLLCLPYIWNYVPSLFVKMESY